MSNRKHFVLPSGTFGVKTKPSASGDNSLAKSRHHIFSSTLNHTARILSKVLKAAKTTEAIPLCLLPTKKDTFAGWTLPFRDWWELPCKND